MKSPLVKPSVRLNMNLDLAASPDNRYPVAGTSGEAQVV
jgi:hypothetical protein